jgi:AraC-like DNA-binding protein
VQVLSFHLAHAPLAAPEMYARRLGALPSFNAGRNEWRLPAEVLARPMPQADPGLVQFFSSYLEERAPSCKAPGDTRDLVRQKICESLPDSVPTLAQLAGQLRTSDRGLQRRLASEGSSLAALVDEVRRTRALAYLQMQLPPAEVSMLLGYSEPSVFHRAFNRWTGQSTTAWRASRA